jgi:CHAT domain
MNLLKLCFYPIEGQQHRFKVIVEGSSGQAHHEPFLPFLDGEISALNIRFIVVRILESTKFHQENFDEDELDWLVDENLLLQDKSNFKRGYLATIGRKLYQILERGIQQVIETARVEAKGLLHISLQFPADDAKHDRLTDYPWELLHDDYEFLARRGVAFSRYIAYRSSLANLPTVERLNVLLISSGIGDKRMGLKSLPTNERKAIASGLQKAQEKGEIQLEILEPPTLKELRIRLQQRQPKLVPNILHFDGHGFFGKRCNECRKAYKVGEIQCECSTPLEEPQGYLVLKQSDRKADYVSAKEISDLLGNFQLGDQPNSAAGIALVVLSSCKSGMSSKGESVFNGVAQNLILQGIPAVVAMTYSIRVDAAAKFAESFYLSLAEKDSLVVAFRRGQSAIGIEGNQWYRPVLYLRWADNEGGQLFKDASVRSDGVTQALPTTQVISGKLTTRKLMDLQEELADFLEEREVCKNQYRSTIDDAQKLVLKRKLEKLDQQIAEIESQL